MSESKAFTQVYDQIFSMLCYTPKGADPSKANKVVQLGMNLPINTKDYEGMFAPDNPSGDVSKARNFAMLVNQLPSIGAMGGNSGKNLDEIYSDIIKGANATTQATPEQVARYNKARAVLYAGTKTIPNPDYDEGSKDSPKQITVSVPSTKYQAYIEAKTEYDNAVIAYFSKYDPAWAKTIQGQGELRKRQKKIDDAAQKLKIAGQVEIENALAEMATSMNNGVSMIISEERDLIAKSFLVDPASGKKWGVAFPIPSIQGWVEKTPIDNMSGELDAYMKTVVPQKKQLEDELKSNQEQLTKAKASGNEKDIERYDAKIDVCRDKLDALNEKVQEKLGAITDKYADKIDAQLPLYSEFVFTKSSYKEHQHSSSNSYSAGVAVSYGLFSFGGSTGVTSSHKNADTETSDVKVSGQIATIQIVRPWFNPALFGIKKWTHNSFDKNGISSGNPMDKNAVLPMYTTSIILAKNLSIESKFATTHVDESTFSVDVNAQIGFGPFKFGPKYSHSESDFHCEKTDDGYKLTNKGVQIIGFINEIVPPCPYENDPQNKK